MIYEFAKYVREKIPFPADSMMMDFDTETQVIVGGDLPGDPVDIVLIKENQGVPAAFPQNRQDVPVQFLCRGDTSGRARDLAFAIYDAEALGSKLPDGRKFRERHSFYLTPGGIRIARFYFLQSPFDLGAVAAGYIYSFNAMLIFGDE